MSYNDDKRELLKLKQGIIEESETIKEEEKRPEKYELHGWARVSNFFYHYKWPFIVIVFFSIVIGFLIYSTVTKEKGDMRILLMATENDVSSSMYYKSHDIELALEQYCPDFDENGYVHAEVYYIDMSQNQDSDYYFANQAKLYGELSVATAQIYISDMEMLKEIAGDDGFKNMLVDLSELYPDDPNIVDRYFYRINGTPFADAAKYVETCPENMYMVVRSDFEGLKKLGENEKLRHEQALRIFDNIIKDNKVNQPEEK